METVLLQINNDKVYKLLENLEVLHLIKMLEKSNQPKEKLSVKYAGPPHLSNEEFNNFQNLVTEGRN